MTCRASLAIVLLFVLSSLAPLAVSTVTPGAAGPGNGRGDAQGDLPAAGPGSPDGRALTETSVMGGSWSESFDKGSTARHNGTYLYDDRIQLDINPSTVIKYYNNPVLSTSVGKFDSTALRGNSVICDGGLYKMWYGGYDGNPNKIGYATSIDGRNWTKQNSGNPVLTWGSSGAWDDSGLYMLYVMKDGSTYKMWYTGQHTAYKIGYATSSDGIAWTKYASNPVFAGDGSGFDSSWVAGASVLKDGSTYKMWYFGNNGGGAGSDRIGYAWSSDGTTWSRRANAVLSTSSGKFDSSSQSHPHVLKINQKYYMYYTGYDGSNYRIGVAESWDGINWTKMNSGNAVLTLGVWDSSVLIEHSAVRLAYQYYIYYAGGASATTTKIGNAVANNFLKTGSAMSEKINIPLGMNWDKVLIKKAEPSATGLNITVLDGATNKTITGYVNVTGSSFNISNINASTYKSIRLLANLKGAGTNTPTLYTWGVSWVANNTWRDPFIVPSRISSYNATRFRLKDTRMQLDADPLTWTKDASNPVLTYTGGTWDYSKVMDPDLLTYGNNNYLFYTGNLTGGQKIGYATSNDLKTWTKYASNPVLSNTAPSFDEFGTLGPEVLWTENAARLYYTGENSNYKMLVGMAVSGDLNNYTKYAANPVLSNSAGQWDANSVKDPSLLFVNGTYYMWYAGNQSSPAPVYKIGIAKSSDGFYWTKPSNNKVLDLGNNGKFDYYSLRSPAVIYDKDRYLMFYAGMDDPVKNWKVGLASSPNGTTWTRMNNGDPIITLGANGQWDDTHIMAVDARMINGLYELYYMADSGDGKYQIGHATSGLFSAGTITSQAINCPGNGLWNTLSINKTEPSGTSIQLTLLNATSDASIAGYTGLTVTQMDIRALDAKAYPKVKLKASFQGDGAKTPTLNDWAINWTIAKVEQKSKIPDFSILEDSTNDNITDLSQYFTHKKFSNRTLNYRIDSNTNAVHVNASIDPDGYHLDLKAPVMNWTGSANISVNVSDGSMTLKSNTFKVNVTPVNDAPVWLKIPDKHIVEDTFVDNLVKLPDYTVDSDTPLASCTFSVANPDPTNMTITLDAVNNIDVMPGDNFTGTVKATVNVSDGEFTVKTAFNIIVDAVNDAPVWTRFGPIQMTEDVPVVDIFNLEAMAKDAETPSSALNYTVKDDPLAVKASIAGPHMLSLHPAANYTGTTSLTFDVNDGFYTVSQTVDVIVSPVNDPPYWQAIPVSKMAEDTQRDNLVDLKAYVHDAETPAAGLTYNIESISEPTALIMIDADHNLDVTPGENYFGTITVMVSASDGTLISMTNITIEVLPVNDPPMITSTPVKAAVATEPYQYQVVALDIEGDKLTYSLISVISGMTIGAGSGLLQWTPSDTQTGSYEVKLQVSDGQATAGQDYFIDVTPKASGGNNPPVITSQPPTDAIVGDLYNYTVEAIDADKDPLTFSLAAKPIGMTIQSLDGLIEWTPKSGLEGKHQVVVAVSDGKVQVTQSYEITVYPKGSVINHPPVIISQPVVKTLAGTEYKYRVLATDSDWDTLYYYLALGPVGMSIDNQQGLITWTPNASNVGNYSVVIRVSDGKSNTSQAFTLAVGTINHWPSITSTPAQKATEGKPYIYQIVATDPDPTDKLLYGLSKGPISMNIDSSTGLVTWTPTRKDSGKQVVTVYVTDGIKQVNQTYNIEVTPKSSTNLGLANFPWWIVVVICVVTAVIIGVVVSRKRPHADEGSVSPLASAPASRPPAQSAAAPVKGMVKGSDTGRKVDKGVAKGPDDKTAAVAGTPAPSSIKVHEVIDLDDMEDEPEVPKKDEPVTKGPEGKEVAKEPGKEKDAVKEQSPKPTVSDSKKDESSDDIIGEILGKLGK